MSTRERLEQEKLIQREAGIKLGKHLLSSVRKNVSQGDVSELVTALMEHLCEVNLELADIGSSTDQVVTLLMEGINTLVAETLCEIAHTLKKCGYDAKDPSEEAVTQRQLVGENLTHAYRLTRSHMATEAWLEQKCAEISARKQETGIRKQLAEMLDPGSAPAVVDEVQFRDPFAALHNAAQNPAIDAALISKGIVANGKNGESALARLKELEDAADKAKRGGGANPSPLRSIHDAGQRNPSREGKTTYIPVKRQPS